MTAIGMEFGEFDLPERNRLAAQAIEECAAKHAAMDALLGAGGFLPFPGAAPLSIVASLTVQIPIYKSLARKLAQIYLAPYPDATVESYVESNMRQDSKKSIGAALVVHGGAFLFEAGMQLADQFGGEFLQEIAGDLLKEIAVGFTLAWIPVLGGLISMGLDVMIAVTMTWRVGTMISIYYQNGERWLGNRHETYRRAKEMTGGLSPENTGRVDLNDVAKRESEVERHQVEKLAQFIESLLNVAPDLTDERLHEILRSKDVSQDFAEKVIRHVRRLRR